MANGKPGAPFGNDNGSKNKPWAEAIRKAVVQDGKSLDTVAKALVAAAKLGDMQAIKEMGDRLDGKPHQTIAAEVDASVTVEVVRFGADKAS